MRSQRGSVLALLIGGAVVLPPWIVYLAASLPDQHDAEQWKLVWVGFDIALLGCLASAGWLGVRRRRLAVPVLVATATLMLCDAWFDVLLDWRGSDWWTSLVMAGVVEVPVAVFLLVRAQLLLAVPHRPRTISAEDVREYLTHPVRRRIMEQLDERGVGTGAVAAAVGLDGSLVEHHLDRLAAAGFARRLPGPAGWGTVGQDLRMPERAELDPAMRELFDRFAQARAAEEVELFSRLRPRFLYPDAWHQSSRGGLRLTSTELADFIEDYLALLRWYAFRNRAPQPHAREIAVRFYAFPRADIRPTAT